MRIEKCYCDKCKKEIPENKVLKQGIPVIIERFFTGNTGAKLRMPSNISLVEVEICKECHGKYIEIITSHMYEIAREWERTQ